MKSEPTSTNETIEGPEAFKRFDSLVDAVLSTPHALIARRERAYKKRVAANPNKRGPKRKINPSASLGPVA